MLKILMIEVLCSLLGEVCIGHGQYHNGTELCQEYNSSSHPVIMFV